MEQFRRTPELDEIVCTLADLADTSQTAQRYAFRGAQVLLDRLGGQIGELVEAQATPTEAEATAWARRGLDGYVNQIYRAAKNRRDGQLVQARLDEMESVFWFLVPVPCRINSPITHRGSSPTWNGSLVTVATATCSTPGVTT